MTEDNISSSHYQEIKTTIYPISVPDPEGPEYKKYVYQCSAIPPVVIQKTSEADFKKYKKLECSPFVNVFSEFVMDRRFENFTYSPLIVSLINSASVNRIQSYITKYFYHLKKSELKTSIDLDDTTYNFELYNKNTLYTVALSKSLKDYSNIYLDEDLPDFVKNEFILKLKEHVGAIVILIDSSSEILEKLFVNSFIRTYADAIFFDRIDKKIYDTFSYIGCKSNIQIDIDNYLLCLDRTVLWSDFKAY